MDACFLPVSDTAVRCWPLEASWPEGLAWTPSGDGIIVSGVRNGPSRLWRYQVDGGTPTAITSGEEDAALPTSPRQGNYLAYVLYRKNVNLWQMNIGPSAVQITHGGGFRAFESPDGGYLYYAKGRGKPGLWRRTLSEKSTGKEQPILESLQEWGWWTLGPGVIYFLELPSSVYQRVHLKVLNIAEGDIHELATLPYPVVNAASAIAASRDGRHLAYTQIDSNEADVMLIENFR